MCVIKGYTTRYLCNSQEGVNVPYLVDSQGCHGNGTQVTSLIAEISQIQSLVKQALKRLDTGGHLRQYHCDNMYDKSHIKQETNFELHRAEICNATKFGQR